MKTRRPQSVLRAEGSGGGHSEKSRRSLFSPEPPFFSSSLTKRLHSSPSTLTRPGYSSLLKGEQDKSPTVHFPWEEKLYGLSGAQRVCEAISHRAAVTTLSLPHHKLGDEGATELFRWLCSSGRNYWRQITDIDVSDNGIGEKGLAAISDYLQKNRRLKVLTLTKNEPRWSEDLLLAFANAVNSSRLQDLVFNNVPHGDLFVPRLLSRLNNPHLKALRVSMTGLTEQSTSAICDFIVSPHCRLYRLSLSGNFLGQSGVKAILKAMEDNYSLRTVELFANTEEVDYVTKRLIETRNNILINTVSKEARTLLRASRILLLRGSRPRENIQASTNASARGYPELPLELKQDILAFLAPHLSTPQCLRIFDFASSPTTLPFLSVSSAHGCLPDPSAVPFGLSVAPQTPCAGGVCMGAGNSLSCRRETLRADWLLKVGCDVPDSKVATAFLSESRLLLL
ncbi:RNI-like protein [Phanerochaete sordida]|uniref:RNI-like protein n=1 Tax=Phanerochaete sordida TaxID=48140 RepID=A0A9P3FZ84_9APHY|nr:RNI-like protein [Phanerochaete sordida]